MQHQETWYNSGTYRQCVHTFLPNVSSSTPDTPTPLLQLLLLLEVIVIIKETKQPVIQTVPLTGLKGTNLLMQKGKKVGPILCR